MKHTAGDRTPYTYLITHIPTGRFYYGSRYGVGCHPSDLWIYYFTSSNDIKAMIQEDGVESFRIEIRKVFPSVNSCTRWENRVLTKVFRHPNCINRTPAPGISPMAGEKNAMFGKSRPDSIKRMTENNPMKNPDAISRMIISKNKSRNLGLHKKMEMTKEGSKAISDNMKSNNPMKNPEIAARVQDAFKLKFGGHPTAGSIWIANIISKTRKRISSNDLILFPESEGWIKLSNRLPIPDHMHAAHSPLAA